MNSLPEEVSALYKKWLNGIATAEEQQALLDWLNTPGTEEALSDDMWAVWENLRAETAQARSLTPLNRRVPVMRIFRAAVVLLIIVSAAGYLYFSNKQKGVPGDALAKELSVHNDVQPAKSGAILTLADGRQLVLDGAKEGIIAYEQGQPIRLHHDELVYAQAGEAEQSAGINKIVTPGGRHFQIVLSDGTKVWLNATSAIEYPAVFNGKERRVTVSGEAFFEVAKNKAKPFRVITKNTEVQVLGTRFNINTYNDQDKTATTLVEGSLRFRSGAKNILMKPGQLVVAHTKTKDLKLVEKADVDHITAWKNGVFDFENVSLPEVMQELSRWYDIKVVYTAEVPQIVFGGRMGRDLSLSQVLTALKAMGVTFTLKNKILYVK
ncbi:FecR family protein [Niabella aquatica]